MDPGYIRTIDNESELISKTNYQKLIGSILYIALNSRPDISSSVCILAKKTSQATQKDWNELERVLKYLKETSNLKLHMGNQNDIQSYAEDRNDRKSMSGYIFKLNGGIINWSSRKQTCVTLSSTEAEFVALTEACKEEIWINKDSHEIKEEIGPVLLNEDNTAGIKMITNEKVSNRTKHMDVRYIFIRELARNNEFIFEGCRTEKMLADG